MQLNGRLNFRSRALKRNQKFNCNTIKLNFKIKKEGDEEKHGTIFKPTAGLLLLAVWLELSLIAHTKQLDAVSGCSNNLMLFVSTSDVYLNILLKV